MRAVVRLAAGPTLRDWLLPVAVATGATVTCVALVRTVILAPCAMFVPLSVSGAEAYADEKQRDPHPRWRAPKPRLHPGWLAARMTPLLKHSYRYGPSIHTRSRILHLGPGLAGVAVVVNGRFVAAFERKGHHYAVLDGLVSSVEGEPIARLRHTTIFRIARPAS